MNTLNGLGWLFIAMATGAWLGVKYGKQEITIGLGLATICFTIVVLSRLLG